MNGAQRTPLLAVVAAVATALLAAPRAAAQSFSFRSMCHLHQVADVRGDYEKRFNALLLPAPPKGAAPRAAAVFCAVPVTLSAGFETSLRFALPAAGMATEGGLALVLQGAATVLDTSAVGGGSGLGYDDLANAVAVELDWSGDTARGDPPYAHLSLHVPSTRGGALSANENASFAAPIALPPAATAPGTHTVSVRYNRSSSVLRVSVDGDAVVATWSLEVLDWLHLGFASSARVGWTAGAAASSALHHELESWNFSSSGVNQCVAGFEVAGCEPNMNGLFSSLCSAPGGCEACRRQLACCSWCTNSGSCSLSAPAVAESACQLLGEEVDTQCEGSLVSSSSIALYLALALSGGAAILCIASLAIWLARRGRPRRTRAIKVKGRRASLPGAPRRASASSNHRRGSSATAVAATPAGAFGAAPLGASASSAHDLVAGALPVVAPQRLLFREPPPAAFAGAAPASR
jgi:hypothetical protein